MLFTASFFTLSIAFSGVVASPVDAGQPASADIIVEFNLSIDTKYNAPNAPWEQDSHPGWYYGNGKPEIQSNKYPCLTSGSQSCGYLKSHPGQLQCPPQNSQYGYTQTFSGLTGATQADDYMTYGLVDTVDDCQAMCESVEGCKFVNTYYDVNGKDGSTQLTCSLFTLCHTSSDADNRGGQTQPNGSVDYITDSAGWCKN